MDSTYVNIAQGNFRNGLNCAQSVVSAFTKQLELDDRTAKRISSCFGGGMRMGATCGALSGALMVLGFAKGFDEFTIERKTNTDNLCIEFVAKWKEKVGNTNCREILGLDVSNPAERQRGKDEGIYERFCPNCIETAVRLLEAYII